MAEEPAAQGRFAYVVSQLYYYVAAVIGVGFVIGGAIAALFGVREMVLPREFETVRDGLRNVLHGLAFALPGLALVWSHLREARRREGEPFAEAFWGGTLYFHLVALVAVVFVLVGVSGILHSLVDLILPSCEPRGTATFTPEGVVGDCYPTATEALRQMLDFAIVLLVAVPAFWWHLRRGRRSVRPV